MKVWGDLKLGLDFLVNYIKGEKTGKNAMKLG